MEFFLGHRKVEAVEKDAKKIKLENETVSKTLSLEKRKELINLCKAYKSLGEEITKLASEAHGYFGVDAFLFFSYEDALEFCEQNNIKKKKIGWAAAVQNKPYGLMMGFTNGYVDPKPEATPNLEKNE